jgi:hypothetical protein
MSLARFAFQACSIDHSDISPFRINGLRAAWNVYRQTLLQILTSRYAVCIQRLACLSRSIVEEIVSDLLMSSDHLRRFLVGSADDRPVLMVVPTKLAGTVAGW